MAHSAPHHPQIQVSVVALLLIHCRPLIPSHVGHGYWSSLVMSGRLLVVSWSWSASVWVWVGLAGPAAPLPPVSGRLSRPEAVKSAVGVP
jgi:hypothetical protein